MTRFQLNYWYFNFGSKRPLAIVCPYLAHSNHNNNKTCRFTIEALPGGVVWLVPGRILQHHVQVLDLQAAPERLLLVALPTTAEQEYVRLQGAAHL